MGVGVRMIGGALLGCQGKQSTTVYDTVRGVVAVEGLFRCSGVGRLGDGLLVAGCATDTGLWCVEGAGRANDWPWLCHGTRCKAQPSAPDA